ncbi:MAG: enolase C-terminal domain-like protein [Verrucomicrobiota bacterium]
MIITGITTRLIAVDPRPRYHDGRIPPGRPATWHFPLLTLHTDAGLEGYSTAYGPHGDGAALAEVLHTVYAPELVGENPLHSERIWQKLWRKQRHLYNQRDSLLGVVDVAIWDLRGKIAQAPVAALLGQYRDRIPAYASSRSELFTAEEVFAEAQRLKAVGFHGYKLQLRSGPRQDIPRLHAAREAVGANFPLMQDPNGHYSYSEALAVGRILDELHYHWYEEPLPDQHRALLAQLGRQLRTPLLLGETSRLTELPDFLREGSAALVRGDTLMKGGITGLRKAMAAAEIFGLHLEIHTANTPLMDVANLHVACASANTEFVENHHPVFRFGLKHHPFEVGADGCAYLPTEPGLGVELDWAWLDNHTSALRGPSS